MNVTPSDSAGFEVVDQVSMLVEDVFGRLKPVLTGAEGLLAEGCDATTDDLTRLRPQVMDVLGGIVVGAGFVSAPNALADQEFGFAWWTDTAGGDPARLLISLDPDSESFLDYTRQSWFSVPRDTGRRHINGPYVDYLCTDEYTLTFTVPVRRSGSFAGVVGADIHVREVERLLQPKLRTLGGRAALVNAQGRVIVSNNARQAAGSLVRDIDVTAWWPSGAKPCTTESGIELRRCGDTPIALVRTVR